MELFGVCICFLDTKGQSRPTPICFNAGKTNKNKRTKKEKPKSGFLCSCSLSFSDLLYGACLLNAGHH